MRPVHDQPPSERPSHGRQALAVLAGGLCVTAAAAIWALITGSFDSTTQRVLATAVAAAVATLSGLAGATVLERDDRRHELGQATISVSAIALLLGVVLIWIPTAEDSTAFIRLFGISIAALTACTHASLMHSRLRPDDPDAVRLLTWSAVGAASAGALLISGLLLLATGAVGTGVWRLLGILVVIAVLSTLLTPLARKLASITRSNGSGDPVPANPPDRRDSPGPPKPSLMLGRRTAS
jgi:MFS family permease